MNIHRKDLLPPKFLCISARALLITLTSIFLILCLAGILYDMTHSDFELSSCIFLIPQIIILIAALLVALWALHIARITLILWLIFLVITGMFYVVYHTAGMATNKTDGSLDFLWQMGNETAMQNSTMFEKDGEQPEELFKAALIFGYGLELAYALVFGESPCIFKKYSINTESMKLFPKNCTEVCAYIQLDSNSNVSESELEVYFKNVKVLYGFVRISKTNVTSLRFLKNLETLECGDENENFLVDTNLQMKQIGMENWKSTNCDIFLRLNDNFEKLYLPNLKSFPTEVSIEIFGSFCLSVEEISNFYSSPNVTLKNVPDQFCPFSNISIIQEERICVISQNFSLKNFDETCQRLFGVLKIGPGDESYVYKLRNVTWIYGQLEIHNTNLDKIDFFESLEYFITLGEFISMKITKNPKLEVSMFPKLRKIQGKNIAPIIFYENFETFDKNVKTCQEFMLSSRSLEREFGFIDEQRCEPLCIFHQFNINSETFKSFPKNCSEVCAYLQIDSDSIITELDLENAFQNVKILFGYVRILHSNLKNLQFLKNLTVLECEPKEKIYISKNKFLTEIGMENWESTNCEIEISDNPLLEKFNSPNLKNFSNLDLNFLIKFQSENFCLSFQEITHFSKIPYFQVFAREVNYCASNVSMVEDEKFCEIPENVGLKSFDETCRRVLGILKIVPGDENYVYKLKNITWIYGNLLVQETNLTTIDFLDNLEYVVALNYQENYPTIQLLKNQNLENVKFPKLHVAQLSYSVGIPIEFSLNHESLSKNPKVCSEIMHQINTTNIDFLLIDRKNCETIQKEFAKNCETGNQFLFMLFIFFFSMC
ncbi:Protein CBG06510 [Caenorhabditis briggsae]|uniref:Protein CBG06510 n=1 Tax=Caenorhabditis briggsae TaxID=6238 RepID=A8X2E4_CAEBR|nr:Protein CBG06510 [Caenorhabditis briggsae]CAP26804.2 Protein CBG06510 [Caenorhabditis briggsae]